ncbi:MAG: CRTAC1 family protein [Alphaproteobacteria bacterium]|nr:CRTAC1 family protein [Alphaproteobacteria bacterium]
MIKKALAIVILLLVVAVISAHRLWLPAVDVAEATMLDSTVLIVPRYREAPVDFRHAYGGPPTLPFVGAAMIDTDGDGREEVFIGGGGGQGDGLLAWRGGRFVNVIADSGLSEPTAAYGALSLDLDDDRDVDLVVAREDGLRLYRNDGRGRFAAETLPLPLLPGAIPVAITAGDVNRDGRADLYVTAIVRTLDDQETAVFDDPLAETQAILLLGDRKVGFRDGTAAAGLGERQNSLHALLVDLDNDGWQDLAVAQRLGHLLVFRNRGDGTFSLAATPTRFGSWLAMATGDYDGDGDMDLFLSNAGNTVPDYLLRSHTPEGDPPTREWALLRNDGGLRFVDIGAAAGLVGFEFGWGAAFSDANLDGRADLVVAQNDTDWPAHIWDKASARLLLQDASGAFVPATQASGAENAAFGQAVLSADFDSNGHPDLLYVNLDGPPRAFLNQGDESRSVTVRLADATRAIGARVTVRRADGLRLSGQVTAGGGFMNDPSATMTFGLGAGDAPVDIEVIWPDRRKRSYRKVAPGSILQVKRPN